MYQCAAPSAPAYAQAWEEKGAVIKAFDPPQRISARQFFASDGHRWLRITEQVQCTPRTAACTKWLFFCNSWLLWRLDLFAPWADAEGQPLWQPCSNCPKGATNTEGGKMYECNAPHAPVYANASENKGPPVKTLGRPEYVEAKELRSDDGRRWLRFTDNRGQSKPPSHLPWLFFVIAHRLHLGVQDCLLLGWTSKGDCCGRLKAKGLQQWTM